MKIPKFYEVKCQYPWADPPRYYYTHPEHGYICGGYNTIGDVLHSWMQCNGVLVESIKMSQVEFDKMKDSLPLAPDVEIPDFTR